MIQATQILPKDYQPGGALDLSRQRGLALGLGLGSLALLAAAGWLVLRVLPLLRSDIGQLTVSVSGTGELLALLGYGLGLLVLMIVLHEAIHGALFWYYTGDRPRFGVTGLYAYAAAPGWYLPRGQHIVVALGPLIVITLGGLALAAVVPLSALLWVLAFVVANIAGAIGDIVVVVWLLGQPRAALIHDSGDAVAVFLPDREVAGHG